MADRLVLRIPIRVTIIDNKTNETIESSTYTKQSQLTKFVQLRTKQNAKKEVTFNAKVLYNHKDGYFNEFDFVTADEFAKKLAPCIERPLLKDLLKNKVLPADYVSGL